ncbi:MAG: hypothetical protein QM724_04705 [Flavobacteriales bacterium]
MATLASATTQELIFQRSGLLVLILSLILGIIGMVSGVDIRVIIFSGLITWCFHLVLDYLGYSKFDLAVIYCGEALFINGLEVSPKDIISIRPLTYFHGRNSIDLVEIVFKTPSDTQKVLAAGKPTWFWRSNNRTIDIILDRSPELKDRLLSYYVTPKAKKILDPSLREPEPQAPDRSQVSPHARYRDPYFSARRRTGRPTG